MSKLQAEVRIGGKGTPRRKKKVVHKTSVTDEKKLQSVLKKIGANSITGIEEANFFRADGKVLHFKNPKVQASIPSNTFAITGPYEEKSMAEILPHVLQQLGTRDYEGLKKIASSMQGEKDAIPEENDDEVPELVGNFEDASKKASA